MTDPLQVLKRLPLLEGVGDEALAAVAGRVVARKLPRDGMLFREGDVCRGLYIVARGRVMAYQASPDGKEQLFEMAGPGQSIAELPVFDGGPYPASARAVDDSEVLFLSTDDLRQLYRQYPEIADTVIARLGQRLRKLVRLVSTLTLKDVSARVASRLIDQATLAGRLQDGATFILPRRHYELAAELATTRESVTRAFVRLRKDGIISQKGPAVTIRDLGRLRQVAAHGLRGGGQAG